MSTNNLYLQIPNTDIALVSMLAQKMGWKIETSDSLLERFVNSRPTNVPLSDDSVNDYGCPPHCNYDSKGDY